MRDLDRIEEKVVIRLDNRQVGMAIFGFVVVSIGTFAGGVVVGKHMSDAVNVDLAGTNAAIALHDVEEHRNRSKWLAQVEPATTNIHAELAGPPNQLAPSDSAAAARIETHRQIAAARRGVARSLGPVAVGPMTPAKNPPTAPVTMVQRNPANERSALDAKPAGRSQGYCLQVAAFSKEGPARTVAAQLSSSGHKALVSTVVNAQGHTMFRVHVGKFADAKAAERYQRKFDRDSGYSTVLVPLR